MIDFLVDFWFAVFVIGFTIGFPLYIIFWWINKDNDEMY